MHKAVPWSAIWLGGAAESPAFWRFRHQNQRTEGCAMAELRTLMSGLVFGEQPRWHQGRLWFSDWGTQEVIAVDPGGNSEVILRGSSFPLCVDWLPDGTLLLVSARDGLLLRREPDGSLVTHGDLKTASDPPAVNGSSSTAAATPTSTAAAST
jgi:sugar lactone lactonase YvrE